MQARLIIVISTILYIFKKKGENLMSILVVYYTRTGNTRKIAKEIAEKLNADLEEIVDKTKRSGLIGWLRSGYQATTEKLTEIEEIKKKPEEYEILILGTPNWGGKMTPALRTYITQYKDQINKLACFITLGGRKGDELIQSIGKFCEKDPIATLQILRAELKNNKYQEKLDKFIHAIS